MFSSWIPEEKWKKYNKSLIKIQLHLSSDILQDVLWEKSIVALWLKLDQLCMTKSLPNKLYLKQHLYSHRLVEGMFVIDHISTFKVIIVDLEIMKVKYDEKDLASLLHKFSRHYFILSWYSHFERGLWSSIFKTNYEATCWLAWGKGWKPCCYRLLE